VAKVRVVITDSSEFNIAAANLTPAVNEKVISIDLSGQLSGNGNLTDIKIIKDAIDDAVKAYHPAEVCTYFTNKSTLDLMLNAQGLGVEINSISDKGYEGALAYLTAA